MNSVTRLERHHLKLQPTFLGSVRAANMIRQPFTETDILALHDAFLTNGVHCFKSMNMKEGRSIVCAVLDSLEYYHQPGTLSVNQQPLKNEACNIYATIATLQPSKEVFIEFLLNNFYFDFFWIEANAMLFSCEWFSTFQEALLELNLERTLPIVIVL